MIETAGAISSEAALCKMCAPRMPSIFASATDAVRDSRIACWDVSGGMIAPLGNPTRDFVSQRFQRQMTRCRAILLPFLQCAHRDFQLQRGLGLGKFISFSPSR